MWTSLLKHYCAVCSFPCEVLNCNHTGLAKPFLLVHVVTLRKRQKAHFKSAYDFQIAWKWMEAASRKSRKSQQHGLKPVKIKYVCLIVKCAFSVFVGCNSSMFGWGWNGGVLIKSIYDEVQWKQTLWINHDVQRSAGETENSGRRENIRSAWNDEKTSLPQINKWNKHISITFSAFSII